SQKPSSSTCGSVSAGIRAWPRPQPEQGGRGCLGSRRSVGFAVARRGATIFSAPRAPRVVEIVGPKEKVMKRSLAAAAVTLTIAGAVHAQPPGITREMIMRQLPLEGAPVAVVGPYETVMEPAFGSAGHAVYRPSDIAALPAGEKLPIVAWGNGGCAR